MSDGPYMPGYEGWAVFDSLPKEVKAAHDVVWTGYPHYTNQFRTNLQMVNLSLDDARAIVELDGGKHLLAASDINGRDSCIFENY